MWLVIGYGNSLRSDDRFGLEVIEQLKSTRIRHLSEIMAVPQLMPELAEPVSRAEGVIFVDASTCLSPGELRCIPLNQEYMEQAEVFSSSHHYVAEQLLRDAQVLYGHAPRGWLYTVGGSTFDLGEQLSPQTKASIPTVVKLILEKLQNSHLSSNESTERMSGHRKTSKS
jgi:hydrogenase maturation protease